MALLNAIQLLNELERAEQLRKCGGDQRKIDMFGMCYKKHTDLNSNGLTAAVIRWIELHGGFAERISVQGTYVKGKTIQRGMYGVVRTEGKYIPSNMVKGASDISAIIKTLKGTVIPWKIEVKINKDKMSNDQIKYKKMTEDAGGKYDVVRNFEDFINKYDYLMDNY